jgi:hypothetical protein
MGSQQFITPFTAYTHLRMANIKLLARAGYASRGIVYLVVGGLAALAALGEGGSTTDSRGALVTVLTAPFGKILLTALAAGLLCFAAWRLVQAMLDADCHGTSAKGLVIRSGLAVSGLTYISLAIFAASVALGWGFSGGSGSGGNSSETWTAKLLGQPAGAWLVAIIGLVIIGVGIAHFIKAWKAKFARRFEMNEQERDVIMPVSRFGLAARGAAFLIIGGLFIAAAVQHDPSEAGGLSDALYTLQRQPFGQWLLGALAFGLMAFGAYSVIEAFYRRVEIAD